LKIVEALHLIFFYFLFVVPHLGSSEVLDLKERNCQENVKSMKKVKEY
jgi:hypothetical protein